MLKEFLKDTIRKIPLVKQLAKHLFKGVIAKNKQAEISRYHQWFDKVEPNNETLALQRKDAKILHYQPLISVVTPVYNTPATYFEEMVESVRNQSYENWELVLVDDASPSRQVRELIQQYAMLDSRIKYTFLEKGQHIAGATNIAIKQATGEFISLFDHDDVLRPNALYEIALSLNNNPLLDFIYTDEDKIIDGESLRADPFFKPGWNQDYLYSVNYITHFTTIRKTLFEKIGYEDGRFNGAQDWELFLRVTRSIAKENIHHIPKVLYSWRVHDNSTAKSLGAKPYVLEAQKQAITEDLESKGLKNFTLSQDRLYSAQWRLEFSTKNNPTVSIINTNNGSLLDAIEKAEADILILSPYELIHNDFTELLGDCFRSDIGFVVPRVHSKEEVMVQVRSILTEEISNYIESLPDSLSYHYYRTARYNINRVGNQSVVAVEKAKILPHLHKNKEVNSVQEIGRLLSEDGYRHLYNPYAKV